MHSMDTSTRVSDILVGFGNGGGVPTTGGGGVPFWGVPFTGCCSFWGYERGTPLLGNTKMLGNTKILPKP